MPLDVRELCSGPYCLTTVGNGPSFEQTWGRRKCEKFTTMDNRQIVIRKAHLSWKWLRTNGIYERIIAQSILGWWEFKFFKFRSPVQGEVRRKNWCNESLCEEVSNF